MAAKISTVDRIVADIEKTFSTFGGGRADEWNPISIAMKNKPAMFAAGVDVRAVVDFVVSRWRAADRHHEPVPHPDDATLASLAVRAPTVDRDLVVGSDGHAAARGRSLSTRVRRTRARAARRRSGKVR